jgi:hypothetical protein
MLIVIAESRHMRSNESVIRRIRVTIGKISLLRDNVCTDIADNGPAPYKSIVHSLYHFDLPHNLLQKTRLFGIMP